MKAARNAIRFPLEASVQFWWKDETGTDHQNEGRSRDISERGVFVVSNDCPPQGVKIGLRLSLEELPNVARGLWMAIDGYVLRVENWAGGWGREKYGFAVFSEEAMLKENDQTDRA